MMTDYVKLEGIAAEIRKDIVTMVHQAGDGHPGPALSITDIITSLYFSILRVDPQNPSWEDRDRFILSKGHACPVLYAALARRGYIDHSLLPTLRQLGSILQGHPDMKKTPGVDMTSGSLGNGLPIGAGMAIAGKYLNKDYYTFVITGDGELEEGVVWEAMMSSVKYQLGRLIVFVDHNGFQSGDSVNEISGLLPILPKWEAFGWHTQVIDGHDMQAIHDAVDAAKGVLDTPSVIIAKTVKGKGVSFMENNNAWHKGVPTAEQLKQAVQELGGGVK